MAIHSPIMAIVFLIVSLSCFILNLVTLIFFIRLKEHQKVSSYGVFNILLTNILQSLLTLPTYSLLGFEWNHDENAVICDIFLFTYFTFMHETIFSLLLITMDRVVSIARPLHYGAICTHSKVKKSIIISWMLILVFDIIPFFNSSKRSRCHYFPSRDWSIIMQVITNFIPFVILLFSWLYIVRVALKHKQKLHSKCSAQTTRILDVKATKTTIIILTSYLICYGPAAIFYLLRNTCLYTCFPSKFRNSKADVAIRFLVKLLVILFVILTPLIFCWRQKIFSCSKRAHRTYSLQNQAEHTETLESAAVGM